MLPACGLTPGGQWMHSGKSTSPRACWLLEFIVALLVLLLHYSSWLWLLLLTSVLVITHNDAKYSHYSYRYYYLVIRIITHYCVTMVAMINYYDYYYYDWCDYYYSLLQLWFLWLSITVIAHYCNAYDHYYDWAWQRGTAIRVGFVDSWAAISLFHSSPVYPVILNLHVILPDRSENEIWRG